MSVYGYETIFFTARPMWFMLLTGVFERFPRAADGGHRGGQLLGRRHAVAARHDGHRDHGARKMADTRGTLTMLPSEYFDRNCGIGSSNTRRRELARRYEIGVGNIMWGNDFPHPEGTWPYTREFLKDRFWDIPVDETAQILGLNARRLLQLRPRPAAADRRSHRPDARGARPDRRIGAGQVGDLPQRRADPGSPAKRPCRCRSAEPDRGLIVPLRDRHLTEEEQP